MRRGAFLSAAGVVMLVAGCGGGSSEKGPAGQFVSLGCASCHTLKAADARGRVGPDLDELRPSVAGAEKQITEGGGGMPGYGLRLSRAEIHALAVYVAAAAGS